MKDTMKDIYISCASGLGMGDFTKVKTGKDRTDLITKIADMYCNATDKGDELIRSQAISALMLLFWGEISKMSDKCKAVNEYEYEDFAIHLYTCIESAMQYRAWQDGKHNAEQCIRKLISNRGAPAILYESNLDIRKANYNTTSLDAAVNDDEGHEVTKNDLVEDTSANSYKESLTVQIFVQSIIDSGDLISGIILDRKAFGDSTKEIKTSKVVTDQETGEQTKVLSHSIEYSARCLAKTLTELDTEYIKYFTNVYNVTEAATTAAVKRLKTVDSKGLYKMIESANKQVKIAYQNWLALN